MEWPASPGWRVAGVAAAVLGVYAAGVVTGAFVKPAPAPDPVAGQPSVLDAAADRIREDAARPVDREVLEKAAVEGMLRALGDRWSQFVTAGEAGSFQDALEGRYTGIGLWLRPAASESDGDVVVSSVQAGAPAAAADVLPGDVVLSVDGTDVRRQPVGTVAALLRGPRGTSVTIVVSRDGEPRTVTVPRADVDATDVVVDRLRGGIDVIRVAAFSRGVGKEVREAVARDVTGRSGGVVLDLRGNPGGLLTEAVEVASAFLDGGPVVSFEKRGEPPRTLDAIGDGDAVVPLVVLVDGGTASAAEVVAAALQDRNRAVVVGSRTFGKGSVQEPTTLPDGSALELTVGRYRTPSGRSIDGTGVDPDVSVRATASPDAAEQRALDVLKGLVVAGGGAG